MSKQTDLQGRLASVLLQSNVLLNAACCRRKGWNWCQPSTSRSFPPRCSSLRPRQALYCFFPCPLPFSDINSLFLLFLIWNKEEQQGRCAMLPAAGLPGRQPVPCCGVATAAASFHPEPTSLALSSHRDAAIESITSPWRASACSSSFRQSMFPGTARGENSPAPSGHSQPIEERKTQSLHRDGL